jgi:predicted GNAT superfamily acetyltransferase
MEPRGIVPGALMGVIASGGGILLAAYDRDHGDQPVGFVLGLLARRDGRLYHASHMLATDPAYQGRGIGAALERRQREAALAQGLDLMTWTFDPLIARNAHLNLHKLGAISRTYHEDYYGPMDDRFNGGLPTDRLLVEWRLDAPVPPVPLSVPAPPTPILIAEGGEAGPPPGADVRWRAALRLGAKGYHRHQRARPRGGAGLAPGAAPRALMGLRAWICRARLRRRRLYTPT